MTRIIHHGSILAVVAILAVAAHAAPNDWPCFRGNDRGGIAPSSDNVPLEWSDTKNVAWKLALPGPGASSPIIFDDNIYITAFSGYGLVKNDPHRNITNLVRHLWCLDRRDGTARWKVQFPTASLHEHGLSEFGFIHGYASSTPVADETGVYLYLGRAGLFAYSHDGKRRWHASVGDKQHNWGSASSPILYENLVILHADVESEAVVAYDKQTGREVWRAASGKGDSWSTPLVVRASGGDELVFHHSVGQTAGKVAAVNPRNGAPLWECSILKDYLCPSPVAKDGVVYWVAYNKGAAVRAGGRGDVTASHVLWKTTRGSEVGTPIIHEGHLYWAHESDGIVYCLDAKTGAVVYQERLQPTAGRIYASGVIAGGRIYYVTREKGTYVLPAKPEFRILAQNRFESDASTFNGTPAVSGSQMFLRSDRFLYCIGQK